MQRVERSVLIPATREDVFALVSDLNRLADWQSGVIEVSREDDGPMRVGASARVVRQIMGQRVDAPLTITAFEPPGRLVVESDTGGIRASGTLELEREGSGTLVTFGMEIRGSGMTAFMEPMIASVAAGDVEASLARLRQEFSGGH